MFWVISVYFNIRNTLPKSGIFLLGHPVYTASVTSYLKLRGIVAGLSLLSSRFDLRSVHLGFVVNKVALGQVFLRVLGFFPVGIMPQSSLFITLKVFIGMTSGRIPGTSEQNSAILQCSSTAKSRQQNVSAHSCRRLYWLHKCTGCLVWWVVGRMDCLHLHFVRPLQNVVN